MERRLMRLTSVVAVVSTVLLCGAAGFADPFPDWDGTIVDPNTYDQTITYSFDAAYHTYRWDITYQDSPNIPNGEVWFEFGVYGDSSRLRGYDYADPASEDWKQYALTSTGWNAKRNGDPVALEWFMDEKPPETGGYYPYPDAGCTQWFEAQFTEALAYGGQYTAIHIKFAMGDTTFTGDDTAFFNNTPELPPSALLGLSMLPLGLAYIRGRRRKQT